MNLKTEKVQAGLRADCNRIFGVIITVAALIWSIQCAAGDRPESASNRSTPAKNLFGGQTQPAAMAPAAVGSYARGCLAGAAVLPANGYGWQVMRLSRKRNWAHPSIVSYIEQFAKDARDLDGWPGLLIGDISQVRGGPMLSGHRSHQIGLDVDIWLKPAPDRALSISEREKISAVSMKKGRFLLDRSHWTERHARLLKRAASYPQVARIFVHPVIKKELCGWANGNRDWLRKIRAWYGHHYHFHVRLQCPHDSLNCENQNPPPAGDGCGSELDWWLSAEAYRPVAKKPSRAASLKLVDLPRGCRAVLDSD